MSSASSHRSRSNHHASLLGITLAALLLMGVLGACAMGATVSSHATTTATDNTTPASGDTTASPTSTTSASTAPTPTRASSAAPTPTPVPVLQGQVVLQSLGAIGANTNSTIADVACPAGYLVAGGGINSGYTNFTTMWAAPISTTQWREELFNQSGSTIYAQVQVMCLHVTGLSGQVVIKGLGSINATTNSVIADVACPAGYLVAGGGVNSGYSSFTTMWNAPISTTTLRVEIYNNGGSTIYAQAQTECLKLG